MLKINYQSKSNCIITSILAREIVYALFFFYSHSQYFQPRAHVVGNAQENGQASLNIDAIKANENDPFQN